MYSRRLSGGSLIVTVINFPVPIPHQHLDTWGSADDFDPRGAAAAMGSNPTPSTSQQKPGQEQFEVIFSPIIISLLIDRHLKFKLPLLFDRCRSLIR